MPETNSGYQQYVELQKQIDVLEAQKEELREEIGTWLPTDGYKDETITAFWTTKKSWKYSPRVDGLNAELKATKKQEEEEGIATAEETKQLTIKVK